MSQILQTRWQMLSTPFSQIYRLGKDENETRELAGRSETDTALLLYHKELRNNSRGAVIGLKTCNFLSLSVTPFRM